MSDSPTWLRDALDSLDAEIDPDLERSIGLDQCEVCGRTSIVIVTVEEYTRLLDVRPTGSIRRFHADLHAALPDRDSGFVHLFIDGVHEHCRVAVEKRHRHHH